MLPTKEAQMSMKLSGLYVYVREVHVPSVCMSVCTGTFYRMGALFLELAVREMPSCRKTHY